MPGKSTIKHKVCRAVGANLNGTPSAALTLSRRPNRPGQHGGGRQAKISPFGQQLKETQKLKAFYGISSKKLRRYYDNAAKVRKQTNVALVQSLETRLDNVVYRLGFAPTIRASRQLVTHGHICVNGRCVDISSFNCQIGDIISINTRTQSQKLVEGFIKSNDRPIPPFLALQPDGKSGRVLQNCSLKDIGLQARPQLSIEHYSRRA